MSPQIIKTLGKTMIYHLIEASPYMEKRGAFQNKGKKIILKGKTCKK